MRITPWVRPFLVAVLLISGQVAGYESDQYTSRGEPIRDSSQVLNRKVNEAIDEIAGNWRRGQNEWRFVKAVYRKLGGMHWVDKLERWAMKSEEVDRLDIPKHRSIYHGLPFYATRVAYFHGVAATIKVNGTLIGTDKIGHFFSQGCKFYRRYRKYGSEERAARRSAFTERGIFGQLTTGTYSNADLVANYEGYLFFRSLFHDGVAPGKPAILRWEDGRPVVQRPFDWADHVNAYWDEALNPNYYDRWLYPHMRKKLTALCAQYGENPKLFAVPGDERLAARYAHLRLRDMRELRLDRLYAATRQEIDPD